jgi:hypothetical protein
VRDSWRLAGVCVFEVWTGCGLGSTWIQDLSSATVMSRATRAVIRLPSSARTTTSMAKPLSARRSSITAERRGHQQTAKFSGATRMDVVINELGRWNQACSFETWRSASRSSSWAGPTGGHFLQPVWALPWDLGRPGHAMAALRRAWTVGTGLLAKGQCRAAWRSCDGASPHVCSAVPLPGRALTVMGGLAAVIGGPVRGQPAARLLHRALHSASSKHRSATGLVSAWQHAGSAARSRGDLHLRQMSSSSGRNTAATSAATAGASSDGPTDGRTRSQVRASGGSSAVGGSQGLDFDMKRGDRESMASKVRSSCDHDVGSTLWPWPPPSYHPPVYAARSVFGNRHTRAHYHSLDLYDHVEIVQFFLACACDSLVLLFCRVCFCAQGGGEPE